MTPRPAHPTQTPGSRTRPKTGLRQPPGQAPDRGSITLMVALLLPVVMLVVGLVLDGSTYLRAAREATTVAQEAARAAGQRLTPDAINGQASTVDPVAGADAARDYLNAARVQGQVVVSGDTITISTSTTWQASVLRLFGRPGGTAEGSATVTTERT